MGIKMPSAIDEAGYEWGADQYIKGAGQGALTCFYCSAGVAHNPAHNRDCHEKSIFIPAYFKLRPHQEHEDNCKHSIGRKITVIADTSEGLLESIRDQKYRFRLAMVGESLASPRGTRPGDKEGNSEDKSPQSREYKDSGKKLLGYVNNAQRVLFLRSECENDLEIERYIELNFQGNKIPWKDFYFEMDRHLEAYAATTRSTISFPMALHGRVKDAPRCVNGFDGPTNVLNLVMDRYRPVSDDANNGVSVQVSVWSKDPRWLQEVRADDEVIVLGFWKAKRGLEETPSKEYRFDKFIKHSLTMTLRLASQIAVCRSGVSTGR